MSAIPLEDSFTDILGKAQRGLKLEDKALARRAGVSPADLRRVKGGAVEEGIILKVAEALGLSGKSLVDSARKAWHPKPQSVDGLAQFNTPYEDMTVNAYSVWDPETREAAVFDTGADSSGMIRFAQEQQLAIKLILLTHTHPDHIADLAQLIKKTSARAFVCELESIAGTEAFSEGKHFKIGNLTIATRQTSGHSRGGITYIISGLARRVAVVGDSMFAGSMGGGLVSYADALNNNRKKILTLEDETILCPGHGPLTTVGEERLHNPFFPEFNQPKP